MPAFVFESESNYSRDDCLPKNAIAIPTAVHVPKIAPIYPKVPEYSAPMVEVANEHSEEDFLRAVRIDERLDWTTLDLSYLVGVLYPDLAVHDRLFFFPSLQDLPHHSYPIHLKLYVTAADQHIPPKTDDQTAPIGTGRPAPKQMLAESGSSCSTACSARKSLARNLLLRNNHTVIDIYTKYFGLCMLYSLSHYTLLSFKRGIERMAMISPHEWDDRLWQMRNVNEEYPLEARIERTLLETGLEALEAWAGAVEVGLGMEDQARTDIALAYGKAGRFLKQACLL